MTVVRISESLCFKVSKKKARVHRVCLKYCRANEQWMPLLQYRQSLYVEETKKDKTFDGVVKMEQKQIEMPQFNCAK